MSKDPTKEVSKTKTAKLVFNRYGERYFLSQVWPAGEKQYRQLPKSRQEATLAAQAGGSASQPTRVEEIIDRLPYADARELDLSGAKAADAYWKRVDFSGSDFYNASLTGASFRDSLLIYAQFREASLSHSVLFEADCEDANFKLADLRNADLTKANLLRTRFENAKVHGCILPEAKLEDNSPADEVDDSIYGDGTKMITVREWLERETKPKASS